MYEGSSARVDSSGKRALPSHSVVVVVSLTELLEPLGYPATQSADIGHTYVRVRTSERLHPLARRSRSS